jgi:hypothetical protein
MKQCLKLSRLLSDTPVELKVSFNLLHDIASRIQLPQHHGDVNSAGWHERRGGIPFLFVAPLIANIEILGCSFRQLNTD